jgi:hypothetical protein
MAEATAEKEQFPVTLVCGFCGLHEETTLPVRLKRPFKLTRGCSRCTIEGSEGERVRLCSRYLQRHGFGQYAEARRPEEIGVVAKAHQWQHGTTIYLEGSAANVYDLMDFVPADYKPSDAQRVREKLLALGGDFVAAIGIFNGALFTTWLLDGVGIIFAFNGESVGLYDFVGEQGAPVEQDLRYLEMRHEDAAKLRALRVCPESGTSEGRE